jgi:hypothetical protein
VLHVSPGTDLTNLRSVNIRSQIGKVLNGA